MGVLSVEQKLARRVYFNKDRGGDTVNDAGPGGLGAHYYSYVRDGLRGDT